MDAHQLNLTIAAIANTLSEQMNEEDFAFWSIVFTQLGASMDGITAFRTLKRGGVFPFEESASIATEAGRNARNQQQNSN